MYSLLLDIPRFFILFLEEFFLIFNQMLSIQAFGRRELAWSAHNLCKQIRPRSGLTNYQAWSRSNLFDTQVVFLNKF